MLFQFPNTEILPAYDSTCQTQTPVCLALRWTHIGIPQASLRRVLLSGSLVAAASRDSARGAKTWCIDTATLTKRLCDSPTDRRHRYQEQIAVASNRNRDHSLRLLLFSLCIGLPRRARTGQEVGRGANLVSVVTPLQRLQLLAHRFSYSCPTGRKCRYNNSRKCCCNPKRRTFTTTSRKTVRTTTRSTIRTTTTWICSPGLKVRDTILSGPAHLVERNESASKSSEDYDESDFIGSFSPLWNLAE